MHRNRPYILLIATIALTLLAAPAGATPVLYPTQSAWAAALSNVVTSAFTAEADAAIYKSYSTAGGLTVAGVNFIGYTGSLGEYNLKVYNPAYDSQYDRGSGPSLGGGYSPGYILATLPAGGVAALAFNFATVTRNQSVTILLSSGDSYTITSPADSTMKFFGITSPTPITSVQISAANSLTMVDNFAYGEETSEPAAILLGATGLAGIWLARRLRRYSTAGAAV